MEGSEAKSSSTNEEQKRVLKIAFDEDDEEGSLSELTAEAEQINGNGINGKMNWQTGIKCENCQAYKTNADRAWSILGDYNKATQRINQLENECEQLNRICEESRNYSETLRNTDEVLNETVKEKNIEIQKLHERIANIEDQYDRVLKAGTEAKRSTDELNVLKKKYEVLEQECNNVKKKLNEALAREKDLTKKFKAPLRMLSESKKKGQGHHFNLDTVFKSRFLLEMENMPLIEDDLDLALTLAAGNGPSSSIPEVEPQIKMFEENEPTIQNEFQIKNSPSLPSPEKEPTIPKSQIKEKTASSIPKLQIVNSPEKESTIQNELQIEETTFTNLQIDCSSEPEEEPTTQKVQFEEEVASIQNQKRQISPEDAPIVIIQKSQNDEEAVSSLIQNRQIEIAPEKEKPNLQIESSPERQEEPTFQKAQIEEKVNSSIQNRQIHSSLKPEDEPTTSNKPQKRISHQKPNQNEEEKTVASSIPNKIDPSQIKIDISQPKKLAINDIKKKYHIDKDEATLLYCQAIREQKKKWLGGKRKRKISSDGEEEETDDRISTTSSVNVKNPRELMPWFPKNPVLPPNIRLSILAFEEHRRYVAIILNELKADATYRHEENKLELKSLDKKLEEERKFYAETALKKAKNFKAVFNCPDWVVNLFKELQRMKIQLYIGERAFQGIIHSIPWPTNTTTTTKRLLHFRIVKVLSEGAAKVAAIPDIRRKIVLHTEIMSKKMKKQFSNKQPIIDDQQIQEFGLTNNIPLLMDASTLRHLLCSTWSHRIQTYACRLTVMRRVHSATMKSIIIISPPIIASQLNKTTVAQSFVKWALKMNLIFDEKQQSKTSSASTTKKAKKEDEDGNSGEDYESLLEEMGLGFINTKNRMEGKGKRYAIVSFDNPKGAVAEDEQKYCVLVRSAFRLLEKNTEEMQISTTAHAEFLPEVGAEKLTDEEMLWNVVTGLLKGSEEHLNFRINVIKLSAENPNVLQYDRRQSTNLQKLSQEVRQLLSARIQRFCALMDSILELELAVGEYLLMANDENGGTLQIMKEKTDFYMDNEDEMDGVLYDSKWFRDLLNKKMKTVSKNDIDEYWNGVDPHYPLQYQVVKSQIPGALPPAKRK